MPVNFILIDNKKYMWDGRRYENKDDAVKASEEYRKEKFEIQIIEGHLNKEVSTGPAVETASADGKYFVYTRLVAQSAGG